MHRLDPENFAVSIGELQERLQLPPHACVMPYGYEHQVDGVFREVIKHRYDNSTLLIRTQPDFLVVDNDGSYFVEAKQESTAVEAVQLFYNKIYEKMGVTVLYSFPHLTIHARDIPLKEVIVPARYHKEFEAHFYDVFASFGVKVFRFIGDVHKGSGDPFVPLDMDALKMNAHNMEEETK